MELKKAIYTIEEAAKLLACLPEQLLSNAIAKRLDLYVRMPEHLDLYNVGRTEIVRSDIKWADGRRDDSQGPRAHREPDIDFLVVPEEGISLLLKGDLYMGSTFGLGGAFNADGDVITIRPTTPQYEGMYFSADVYLRHLATYRAGIGDLYEQHVIRHPQKFSITSADLLISRLTLDGLLAINESIVTERPLGFPVLDMQLPYVGENLKKLYLLFCQTWEFFDSNDFVLPEKSLISNALKAELGFSDHLAELGLRVIMDVLNDTDNRTGKPRMVAFGMNILIKGSAEHWKPKLDQLPPNPRKEIVQDWFAANGLEKSYVKAAATMIRPGAPKGRKPSYSD